VKSRTGPALTVLALCSLLFTVMAVIAKEATSRLPGPQVAFVRFLFGLAACAIVSARRPMRP
jgi:drug/metabolite transporter (DMT)-like permease